MSVQNKPTEEDVRVKLRAMFASQEVLAADSSARKFFMFAFASVLCLYTCSDDIGRPFRDLLDTQGNLTKNDKAISTACFLPKQDVDRICHHLHPIRILRRAYCDKSQSTEDYDSCATRFWHLWRTGDHYDAMTPEQRAAWLRGLRAGAKLNRRWLEKPSMMEQLADQLREIDMMAEDDMSTEDDMTSDVDMAT